MANDLVVSKQKIASYVHDATDMEKRIFTLEEAIPGLDKLSTQKKLEGDCNASVAKDDSFWKNVINDTAEINDIWNKEKPLAVVEKICRNTEEQVLVRAVGERIKNGLRFPKFKREAKSEYEHEVERLNEQIMPECSTKPRFRFHLGRSTKKILWRILFAISVIASAIVFGILYGLNKGTPSDISTYAGYIIGSGMTIGLLAGAILGLVLFGLIYGISCLVYGIYYLIIGKRKERGRLIRENNAIYDNNVKIERELRDLEYMYNEKAKKENEWNNKRTVKIRDERQSINYAAEKAYIQSQFYANQAAEMRKLLEQLYRQRDKFYSVGIVPPDYRTMDCAYAFDQIFRNDLADNMREAVKIYEERVFRGEIIRGVRSLEAFMGNVSSLLTTLQADMSSIKTQVGLMNKDIVRIYEQQERQNTAMIDDMKRNYAAIESRNRELFKETQMSRYALESIRESNDKIIKYIED